MFTEMDESSASTDIHMWAEKMMPPSPSPSQRWVSQSEMSFDCSPTPPMSGVRRFLGAEGPLSSRLSPCSDDDDCAASPPQLHQKWESKSEGYNDESPAYPSSGLRRGASESCGTAYKKSTQLLPKIDLESDEESYVVRPPPATRLVERWASDSRSSVDSLDESPTPGLRRYVFEGHNTLNKSSNCKQQKRVEHLKDFAKLSPSSRLKSLKRHRDVFGRQSKKI